MKQYKEHRQTETERMRQREGNSMSVLLKKSNYILMRGFSKKNSFFLKKTSVLTRKKKL